MNKLKRIPRLWAILFVALIFTAATTPCVAVTGSNLAYLLLIPGTLYIVIGLTALLRSGAPWEVKFRKWVLRPLFKQEDN